MSNSLLSSVTFRCTAMRTNYVFLFLCSQNILNHKIVMRFPTMILLLDFAFLIICIVAFEIATGQTIDYLFTEEGAAPPPSTGLIILTMICGGYFLLREVVQIVSLLALGNFSAWIWDMGNWLDVSVIFLVFFFCSIMLTRVPMRSDEAFRSGVAITKGILWMSVISFLKSTQVEFSVFVSGVFYVVQRLSAFLLALGVILLMFAQMVSDLLIWLLRNSRILGSI